MDRRPAESTLPRHVEETVEAVELFHVQHQEIASYADVALDRIRATVSQPAFIAVFLLLLIAWVISNLAMPARFRPDPPPYALMESFLSVGAVLLTTLILATQRRADRLASHREKLILQLTLVSEQKSAKMIALLEELRRDLPLVPDRRDSEAEQMTEKVDAASVAEALREET